MAARNVDHLPKKSDTNRGSVFRMGDPMSITAPDIDRDYGTSFEQ